MGTPILQYIPVKREWCDDGPYPKDNELHIFYKDGEPVMLDFLCPCGCGNRCPTHVISIAEKNDPKHRESEWKAHCWGFDPSTLQVTPSIRWMGGCKAHFNIEAGGKVFIHSDSGK